jgi:hypothetical protein
MASAGGIRAGKAYVELYGDDSALQRTLLQSEKRLKSWGKGLMSIGQTTAIAATAMTAPLIGAVNAWQEMGSQIDDISQRTGVSSESLSTLGYAAKQSGTDIESLEKSLRKMEQNLAEAYRGNDQAQESFSRLGLTFEQLKGQTPDQQLRLIGDRLNRIKDPALKTATAMDIFGKSGTALLPMFADGAAGLEAMEAKARELGLELKGDDVAAAAAFGDQLDTLWDVCKRGVFAVGAALGPALTDLVNLVTDYTSKAAKWIDQNRGLIVSAAKLLAGLLAVGVAIMAAGAAMTVLGTALGIGASVVGAIVAGIGVLGSVLAFLMTPIGMVIGGVAAATAAFLYFTGYGGQLVDWLQAKFGEMASIFGKAWGGIVSAVAKGDLGKAAEIAWLTFQVAFYTATAEISAGWSRFCKGFLDAWDTVTFNLARLFADPWNTIQNWWVTGTSAMLDAWDVIMAGIINSFSSATGFLKKGIAALLNLLSGESITLGFEEIDKQTQDEQNKTNSKRDESINNRAKATNEELKRLDADRNDAAKFLDEALEKQRLKRAEELNTSLNGSKERLAKLRDEWDATIEEAKKTSEATIGGKGPRKGPQLPELDGLQAAEKVTLGGTFNAAAVRGLGAGMATGVLERIAKSSEQTARNTSNIPEGPAKVVVAGIQVQKFGPGA